MIGLSLWLGLGVPQEKSWAQSQADDRPLREGVTGQSSRSPFELQSQSLDRVVFRQGVTEATQLSLWKPLRRTQLSGRIIGLDSNEVLIEVDGGDDSSNLPATQRMRISSDQIEGIDPAWKGKSTWEIVLLFEQGDYREYIEALRETELSDIPQWQQLLLLSKVVQAVEALQGPAAAAVPFLRMAESAPDFLYATMPLCWTHAEVENEFYRKCKQWLESPDEVARLLGASWLLQSPDGQQAARVIGQLKSSSKAPVAQLATAQEWRLVPPPDTMRQVGKWMDFRDRMLLPLSLGPTEFLVERLARIGELDLAVGQAVWIATNGATDSIRVTRSLGRTVELLSAGGFQEEAQRVQDWIEELQGVGQ